MINPLEDWTYVWCRTFLVDSRAPFFLGSGAPHCSRAFPLVLHRRGYIYGSGERGHCQQRATEVDECNLDTHLMESVDQVYHVVMLKMGGAELYFATGSEVGASGTSEWSASYAPECQRVATTTLTLRLIKNVRSAAEGLAHFRIGEC